MGSISAIHGDKTITTNTSCVFKGGTMVGKLDNKRGKREDVKNRARHFALQQATYDNY